MKLAVCKVPDKPRIDGSERELSLLSQFPGILYIIKDPAYFGCRKIGIDYQSCLFPDRFTEPVSLQLIAKSCSSPVLPYYCITYRLTCYPVPDHCSFTLVRYPDCRDIRAAESGLCNGFCSH